MLWLMLFLPLGLLVLGFPFFLALLTTATIAIVGFTAVPPTVVAQIMLGSIGQFALLAVPFFIFAGELMGRGGMARRLVAVAIAMFGGIRGSVPITTVGANALYGSISGSTAATVAALGPLFYPQLRKTGYDEKFSTGVITCAGYLDNIIPPSIAMILYCAAAEQSVVKLFAAGVIPGIVLAAIMALYVYFYARWKGLDGGTRFAWPAFVSALKEGAWAIMMPVIVFGGIYGGVFSPTEAAGVACVYAIFVSMLIHREIGWREFWDVAVTSMYLTAQIFLIVAVAGVFSWLLTTSGVATAAVDTIAHLGCRLDGDADHQRVPPDRGLFHRHSVGDSGADAAAASDGAGSRRRSDPLRHHRRNQPQHRDVHAAVRHQYFRGSVDFRRAAAQHLCRPGAVYRASPSSA